MVLTYGIPPELRGRVNLFIQNRHTPSGLSRVYRVTQLRTDGVHCRESAGTGPIVVWFDGIITVYYYYIFNYVCMYGHTSSKSMDQPGKVANPARGQLYCLWFLLCLVAWYGD